jgi:hypothetical protein
MPWHGSKLFDLRKCKRQTSRAVRRVLSPGRLAAAGETAIHLGPTLPPASCGLPADSGGQPSNVRAGPRSTATPLDLAPGGVYLAAWVTPGAGGLLHHRFTLTEDRGPRRSVFCGTVPRVTPGGRYPPPCPVEPGRSSRRSRRSPRGRPPGSSAVVTMLPGRPGGQAHGAGRPGSAPERIPPGPAELTQARTAPSPTPGPPA